MGSFWEEHKKVLLYMIGAVLVLIILFTANSYLGYGTGGSGWFGNDSVFTNGSTNNKTYTHYPDMVIDKTKDYKAKIYLNTGEYFIIDLFESDTPLAVNNFIFLANDKFYNGLNIHYIDPSLLFQTGDPKGDGSGGPGYTFQDEIKSSIKVQPYSVAYANSGADTNGSQFFVIFGDANGSKLSMLQGKFTVFGKVVQGFDVVDKLAKQEVDSNGVPKSLLSISIIEILEE